MEKINITSKDETKRVEISKSEYDELVRSKILLNNLLNSIPDYIYFKDKKSRFIRMSQSMVKLFKGAKSVKDLIGKSDFDFQEKGAAQKYFDAEQDIIKSKKTIINDIEHEVFESGVEQWVSTTKMPLLDDKGEAIGTFGISKDITSTKKMEIEITGKNNMLQAQEEELRQNLEELMATQEHLNKQIKENKKANEELEFEKALLDNLLAYLPDYIYFKDIDSRFIRISKSMIKLFKEANSMENIIGKSDFDFQEKEAARKYFDHEQEIIKTKKPLINDIEHEVFESGIEQWVSTTKMPLLDKKGKAIGTFGISKDISSIKKMELELVEKNQMLEEQQTELEENLEELKAVNIALDRQKELMVSSINYAKSIQDAMLPFKANMDKYFESFILFKPRDIVSGDFYWFAPIYNKKQNNLEAIFLAVIDCTGHGVPGAFMSMIGNRILNDIIMERKIYDPAKILEKMNKELKIALKQEQSENNDGMDVCLCKIELNDDLSRKVIFSGAKRPLYIYRGSRGIVDTINGDRKSIGGYKINSSEVYHTNTEIMIGKKDIIYLTTDGLIDQNDSKRKRYGSIRFTALIERIGKMALDKQKEILNNSLMEHQNGENQRDDITIVGVKF